MPTSSKVLRARAAAYLKSSELVNQQADLVDDALEAHALYKVAKVLWMEYGRYTKLAETQEKKEQGREHEREAKRSNP